MKRTTGFRPVPSGCARMPTTCCMKLLDQGYPAFILYDNGYYKVQVGAYRILGNAIIMERRLRRAGYSTLITT